MSKEKMIFYTAYNFPKVKANCSGENKVTKFSLTILPNGRKAKVFHSEYNQSEYIQSFVDSCDLRKMVERYINGDNTALGLNQGGYSDISKMPTDLLGSYERTKILSKAYNELNPDIKKVITSYETFRDVMLNPGKYVEAPTEAVTNQINESEV